MTLPDLFADAELPENWDSYGALPVSQAARTCARAVMLYIVALDTRQSLPAPQVRPTVRGGVEIEFYHIQRGLQIRIEPDRAHVYVYDDHVPLEAECEIQTLRDLRPFVERFIGS